MEREEGDREREAPTTAGSADDRDSPLTEPERSMLFGGSGLSSSEELAYGTVPDPEIEQVVADDAARERAKVLTGSATLAEVAELLGESSSAIVSRTADDQLATFLLDGHVRYPLWQFRDGKPLPGLPRVVAALSSTWRARKVMAVMAAPTEALDGKTPPQWLAGAGDPGAVVRLLEDLARA